MATIDPNWLTRANGATSFRRMLLLSMEIADDASVSKELRRNARRIVGLLGPVIDKPIAPAARLSTARRQFKRLVEGVKRKAHHTPHIDPKQVSCVSAPKRLIDQASGTPMQPVG